MTEMAIVLPQKFFDRPTLAVARELLGKYLVRRMPARDGARGKTIALMITEVEAYDGPRDRASHAHRGRTPRTTPMFGEAGYFYVYFTYGMHWLVNVVTGPVDYPAAVLLRAGTCRAKIQNSRNPKTDRTAYKTIRVTGPARLTKFLHVGKAENGKPATRATGLWFEDRGMKIRPREISAGKRVGVDYAGPVWASKRYNFKLKNIDVL